MTVESDGGEGASLDCPRCNKIKEERRDELRLAYVRYMDHVLFKNVDASGVKFDEREAIGWPVYQNSDEIILQMDRSCNPRPSERIDSSSGLAILRSNILHFSYLTKPMLDKLTSDSNIDSYTKKQVNE